MGLYLYCMRLNFRAVGSYEVLNRCPICFTKVLVLTEQIKSISLVSFWSSILELKNL